MEEKLCFGLNFPLVPPAMMPGYFNFHVDHSLPVCPIRHSYFLEEFRYISVTGFFSVAQSEGWMVYVKFVELSLKLF